MAVRPVFVPVVSGPRLVETRPVEFQWFPGLSAAQKQRSIDALHAAALRLPGVDAVLEISSKSRQPLGVASSAFNLSSTRGADRHVSVECAFQASKVFERGGPYVDILSMSSRDAKRDQRLQASGRLLAFRGEEGDWGLDPRTAFYDWLYIHALLRQPDLVVGLMGFSAFTDIEFNPERSINCQAYSAALYVSLCNRRMLHEAMSSRESFLGIVGGGTQLDPLPHRLF